YVRQRFPQYRHPLRAGDGLPDTVHFSIAGATAFLVFFTPTTPSASPRNTLCGHAIGIICGYAALWVTGLQHAGPAIVTELGWTIGHDRSADDSPERSASSGGGDDVDCVPWIGQQRPRTSSSSRPQSVCSWRRRS